MNLLNKLQSTSHGSCTLMGFINLALYKCHGTGNKIGDPILHGSKMQDTVGRIIARQENRFNIGFITIMFILTKHYARTFKVLSYKFKIKNIPVHSGKSLFPGHLWFAFVVVFLAEMGRIPCCGRPKSSSSII